jgi:hypothetical protein
LHRRFLQTGRLWPNLLMRHCSGKGKGRASVRQGGIETGN